MSHASAWTWAGPLLLGALHGVNPGMGWLFAVALGLQEKSGRAVWRAMAPLAAGHLLAILAAVVAAAAAGAVLRPRHLQWVVAAALVVFAVRAFRGHGHSARGGMRVSARDLTIWSFLMASAHGAGLMVLPFVIGATEGRSAVPMSAAHAAMMPPTAMTILSVGLVATLAHSAAYLATTAAIAAVVYERLGLRLLRSAWVNLNVVWAASLVVTAALVVAT